ncbi:MAG: gamma-glutamylcyclotransferase family protein [Microbacterium sp.]|uniref:gamma-glutamylcyclotransferase family protein n=1 Tax=Microbacterium sp. TaxID=51671 RepID=UPI0039E5C27E
MSDERVLLFSYGTLRLPHVQLETFGRVVDGEADVLPGYTVDYVDIDDPRVVSVSGHTVHPILRATGNASDKVVGAALALTEEELDAADEYEVPAYRRVGVTLASGRFAWVYVEH